MVMPLTAPRIARQAIKGPLAQAASQVVSRGATHGIHSLTTPVYRIQVTARLRQGEQLMTVGVFRPSPIAVKQQVWYNLQGGGRYAHTGRGR
jgi:hypothetical protein